VSIRILLSVLDDLARQSFALLRNRHDRVVARIGFFVIPLKLCELLRIKMDFGNNRTVDTGKIRRDQRRFSRVSSEGVDHKQFAHANRQTFSSS